MKFDIQDLIKVIGERHGLELSDDFLSNLGGSPEESFPVDFLEEVQRILGPLISLAEEGGIAVDTREDLYKIIPSEYIDNIAPVDEDGEKLMSLSDLRRATK